MNLLKSLRSRLVVLTLVLALIPMIGLTLFAVYNFRETAVEDFIESTDRELTQIDNAIGSFFDAINQNTEYLASDPLVRQADSTITDYLSATTETERNMQPIEAGGIERDIFEKYEHFAETHPATAYVYMATTAGGYIQWPAGSVPENYNPADRPYYQLAMENPGQVNRTEPYYWSADDAIVISTVRTIEDQSGEVIGVQGLDVNLDGLTEIIEEIEIGDSGYIILFTNNGTILSHPERPELNFEDISKLNIPELDNVRNTDSFRAEIEGNDYFMNLERSESTGWYKLAVIEEAELMATADSMRNLLFISLLVLTGLIIIIIGPASGKIVKPISLISELSCKIAEGDLTAKVPEKLTKREDETGQLARSFKTMTSGLVNLIKNQENLTDKLSQSTEDINLHGQELKASSGQVGQAVEEIAAGNEEQTARIMEIEESLRDSIAELNNIKESSNQLVDQAEKAAKETESGQDSINKSITEVQSANTKVDKVGEEIDELDKLAREIGNITELIESISNQTNLLALNAAIEAARAGKEGKGFAVVAEEVRSLAAESSKAAEEITELISNIQNKTQNTKESMTKVEKSMDLSVKEMKSTGTIITNINKINNQLEDFVEILNQKITKVTDSSNLVKDNMGEIAKVSEDTAASSQEMSASVEEQLAATENFADMADELEEEVKNLKKSMDNFKTEQ